MCGLTIAAHALPMSEGSGATRIEDTVKDFWANRPRRPRRGRKLAGVASGIANRYRIDPVLVRVAFVVGAIYGGAGVLLYLLGWLFLPEQDDETSPIESLLGKGRSSTSTGFTILLGIFMVPVLGWFFSGSFTGSFSSWMSLLVMGGLLFLLHQNRGHLTPVTPTASATPPSPTAPAPTMPLYTPMPIPTPWTTATMPTTPPAGSPVDMPAPVNMPPVNVPPLPDERTSPPAWDPLGAAPFAWDLPEPTQPEPEEPEPPVKRRKPRVATATLGIALMAVAGLAIAANASWALNWIDAQHVVGVVLAIVGLGLVFGAFLRAGRGLIALAVPLSVVGMGLTVISPSGYHGVGNLEARPLTTGAVERSYTRSVGDVEVDLRALPANGVVGTDVHSDVGNVTVIVPRDADVNFSCHVAAGNAECLGTEVSGADKDITRRDDYGDDGQGGLQINLTASVGTGNVEVQRG
jgi:phage shock protein PspC (stress-responsive transcriptional regulator)